MTRKTIASLTITALVLVAGLGILSYFQSFKTAYIKIPRSDVSVTVYTSGRKKVDSLSSSGSVKLHAGTYSVVASGTDISTKPITMKVTDTGAYLTVDPGYSDSYLAQQLSVELPRIKQFITTKYPSITAGFTLNDGKLYQYGDWYGTTLPENPVGRGSQGDVYRLVLQKVDGTWKIAAGPQLVISAPYFPGIPHSTLDDLNQQSGY